MAVDSFIDPYLKEEACRTFLSCVFRLCDPGQAEVCYLTVQGVTDQDVGRTHVSVDEVLLLDVGHSLSYLSYLKIRKRALETGLFI